MADRFTTKEMCDEERRKREDSCYTGHDYVEVSRNSQSRRRKEFDREDVEMQFRNHYDSSRFWWVVDSWEKVIYKCRTCGDQRTRIENERSGRE